MTTPYLGLALRSVHPAVTSAPAIPTILVNRNAIGARLACALPDS